MTVPSNRAWLPKYCDPDSYLPAVQETVILFRQKPYLFQDFVARAISFLNSDEVKAMGFTYDPRTALPCKWKCSDESLFGVDLVLYAYTGHYPFDKGRIGGGFNEGAVGAAVHHSATNIDFGGSHVGYQPGEGGGSFGLLDRPLHESEISTSCGHLMATVLPFKRAYDNACANIYLFCPEGRDVLISVPNEYIQPGWSQDQIKLLVDLETLTRDAIPYDFNKPHTHKLAGRSLFTVSEHFLQTADTDMVARFRTPHHTPIGMELTAEFFNIFDAAVELHTDGVPRKRILPYMKYVLSSKLAPFPVKAAVTNTNIEYNRLTDCVRHEENRQFAFASFTGVFIDVFDERSDNYINLFQPIGISIKPPGKNREISLPPADVHELIDDQEPAEPVLPLKGVLAYDPPIHVVDSFTFRPGHFTRSTPR